MDKLFAANVSTAAPTDIGTSGYPSDGNASAGQLPTIPGAYWFWMITAEILAVIVGAGLTPNGTALNQLYEAITTIANNAAAAVETVVLGWFTGANQSYTPNGFQVLPGGGIRNWCQQSATGGDIDVTFTYAKPFTLFSAIPVPSVVDASVAGGNESNALICTVISYSLTGCVIGFGQNGGGSRTFVAAVSTEGK